MNVLKVIAALAVPLLLSNSKNQATLVIKQGNKEIHREKISKTERKIIKVKLPRGYNAEIVVSEGKAWVKKMPNWVCPKHICSEMGKISFQDGKKIVCAPNKLIVYFEN